MNASPRSLGADIARQKGELAQLIVNEQWARNPRLGQQYGLRGRTKCVEDVAHNLAYLSESVSVESLPLFEAYVDWIKILFEGLGIPIEDLSQSIRISGEVLFKRFPDSEELLRPYFEAAHEHLARGPEESPSFIDDSQPLAAMARQYFDLLRNGHRFECSRLILSAVDQGVSVKDIYLHVFQPCQRETGRLWQMNQLSVAEEHYCTAATQLIMSQLSPYIFGTKRIGRNLVAACVGGELHEIGLRMVADFFELEGWDTYYLGSSTPTADIVKTVENRHADVLAISATITYNVELVTELIEQVRNANSPPGVKILVGGYPFNIDPELWRKIGADGCAFSALDAVKVATALIEK